MALFGIGNQKAETKPTAPEATTSATHGVIVLGSGCARCQALEKATAEAVAELNMADKVDHIRDFAQIAAYGVMSMPALVVDGRVAVSGRVPSKAELVTILKKERGVE
jgi:small redox-active disulfide protein 2